MQIKLLHMYIPVDCDVLQLKHWVGFRYFTTETRVKFLYCIVSKQIYWSDLLYFQLIWS